MASYYKQGVPEDSLPLYKGFHLQKIKKFKGSFPRIKHDFSKHVLIELLDDSTPESKLWAELGLSNCKSIIHKRMMVDSHRIQCRRAVVVCSSSSEAKKLAERVSQTKIMNRSVCAVVVKELLSDLCLFEKQIMQFGDSRPQHQFVYVTDLNRHRAPSGLVKFLKETFSPFGTILSVLVCSSGDEYAHPEGVIRFAYLSEPFAAELAMDQFVIGRERLSVTSHHNILLSQCDLRVRLREAQRKNGMEPEPDSYELNDLSTLEENSVINSISSLCITSKNISANEITLDNLSVLSPRDNRNDKDKADCFKIGNCDKSQSQTQNLRNTAGSEKEIEAPYKNDILSKNAKLTDCYHKTEQIGCLNSKINQECSSTRDMSDWDSFVTCLDPISEVTCIHSDERNAEYYSISPNQKQLLHDIKLKRRERKSKKRKYYTPSQKLCLKSQRVGQHPSAASPPLLEWRSDALSLPEEPEQSRVTSWLSRHHFREDSSNEVRHPNRISGHNPFNREDSSSEVRRPNMISGHNAFNREDSSNEVQRPNQISVHSAFDPEHCQKSDDTSSVENDDPNVLFCENSAVLCTDRFQSPLQAWLKQELVSSINNNVTHSRDTSKSVVVCAARTKDFIISVGCSHMTCDVCYPDSNDLLLGFS